MDAAQKLAGYYEALVERCNHDPSARPVNLPRHDQIIYYVISTRCEMDMNGFDSVFDQLLTRHEVRLLIGGLNELGATELAALFDEARSRLEAAGFFDDDEMMVLDLDSDEAGILEDIEEKIRDGGQLWDLDERLVALIPPGA